MIVLEHYLKKQGMTQAELSRRTGISTSTVSDICRNRRFPTEAQHKKICEALGLDGSNATLPYRIYRTAWEYDEPDPETLKDRFHMDFGEMLLYANDLRVWAETIEDFCGKFEGMTQDELLSYKAD